MKNIILVISFSFVLVSCDLFTTRDAETPDQSRSNYEPPVEPSIVIQNLVNSLSDKNSQNYLACLVDPLYAQKSFSFSASSEAAANYQIFLQGWGATEEERYITTVFNNVPEDYPVSLTLSDENYGNLSGDSLIYTAQYNLNVPSSAIGDASISYGGNLQLSMLRDTRAYWVIYFWKDTKGESLPSWSELKGSSY